MSSSAYIPVASQDDTLQIPLSRISLDSSLSKDQQSGDHWEGEDGFTSKEQQLPPTDTGWPAWRFLLGTWIIEAFLWSFPLTFGIFQSHYSQHPLFKESRLIPTVGSMATGISYLGVPLINPIALKFARYQWHITAFGWCLCVAGLVGASFATRAWHLVLTQGVMYGSGWAITYVPFLIQLNEWFVEKRGLAYGILFGASGVGGLYIPFILEAVLNTYGFRTALRSYAIATVVCSGPALFMLIPRNPNHALRPGSAFALDITNAVDFYGFASSTFLQGLAFFLPNIFLPSFATSLGLSDTQGAVLLALNSLAQVSGQLLLGHMSDKMDVHIPTTASSIITCIAVFFLWGPAKGLGLLLPFALIWGFFAGSYSVLWTRIATTLTTSPEGVMTVYGIFSFERGLANILEGPISSWLLQEGVNKGVYGLSRYEGIVVFTGITLLLSSFGGLTYFASRR